MTITKENICELPDNDKLLIKALLGDLYEINEILSSKNNSKKLHINWIDEHTEYSPERVDPCPDYYGMYQIKCENHILGENMTLEELDNSLYLLYEFVRYV